MTTTQTLKSPSGAIITVRSYFKNDAEASREPAPTTPPSNSTIRPPTTQPSTTKSPTTQPSSITRWRTYTGAPVITMIPALEPGHIEMVVDLDTLTVPKEIIPALHSHTIPVGTWERITIGATGVEADLHLLDAQPESHGLAMYDAARELRLSIDGGIPWQASLGLKPSRHGKYMPVRAKTAVNGFTLDPEPDALPTYILYGGELTEMSIVLFGADSQTSRLASHSLLASHSRTAVRLQLGGGQRGFAALHAARLGRMIAQRVPSLAPSASAPRTITEAMALMRSPSGEPLRGFASLSAARAAYPNLSH